MDAAGTAPIVHEALPLAAQWGILGVLVLVFGVAIAYLVSKLDGVREKHAAELRELHEKHTAEIGRLHGEFTKASAEYARSIAELLGPVEDVVAQVETITKALASRASRRRETEPRESQR